MTSRHNRQNLLLTAGMAVLLAACSGTSGPAATRGAGATAAPVANVSPAPVPARTAGATAAASVDTGADTSAACALVTPAAVATAVGYSIATVSGAGGTCIYQNADPSQVFAVQLFDTQDGMAPYLSVEDQAEHVAGLGDDVFWQGTLGFMFVRKGTRAIMFLDQAWIMTPPTDTAHRDSLVTLARAALPNL